MRKISEVMTTNVKVVRPDETIQNAAKLMADLDIGAIPVCDGTKLQGMLTDRDIAVRAVAEGRGGNTPVGEVMTADIVWCTDEDNTQEVLDRMAEDGAITKDEAKAAKAEKIEFKQMELGNIKAPHFVFYVRDQLVAQFGEDAINQGGMKIITTLDWDKQQAAEDAVAKQNEANKAKGATDAALVSVDAKTGEILAMVGSEDFFDDSIAGKVNVAIETTRLEHFYQDGHDIGVNAFKTVDRAVDGVAILGVAN